MARAAAQRRGLTEGGGSFGDVVKDPKPNCHNGATVTADASNSPARPRDVAIAVVGILACTIGPVLQLRRRMNGPATVYLDDPASVLFYGSIYAAALASLSRDLPWSRRLRPWSWLLGAYGGLALLSTWWSVDQPRTFVYAVLMLGTMVFGCFLAQRFSLEAIVGIAWVTLHAGALVSAWAIKRQWPLSHDENGRWTGIYINRNSLGPVAMLGLVVAGFAVPVVFSRARADRRWWLAMVAVAVGAVLDVRLELGARSTTPLAGALFAAMFTAAWYLLRLIRRQSGRPAAGFVHAGTASVVLLAGIGWLVRERLVRLFGRDRNLDGRREIWIGTVKLIRQHPLRGWGWMAVWGVPDLQKIIDRPFVGGVPFAHNTYLEAVLGMGLVGGLLLLAIVLAALTLAGSEAVEGAGAISLFPIACVGYALMVNVTEQSFDANQVPLVFLVAAVASAQMRRSSRTNANRSSPA
jgi:O-antigen ligase